MTKLLIGAALFPLALMGSGAAQAGFVADRCVSDAGGSVEACRCVERDLASTAGPRLLPIVQAIASGRSEVARTLILDLSPTERTGLQDGLVRATAEASTRCGAVWSPKPTTG